MPGAAHPKTRESMIRLACDHELSLLRLSQSRDRHYKASSSDVANPITLTTQCFSHARNVLSQCSLQSAPIFRLLLKVAVNGTHQRESLHFCRDVRVNRKGGSWLTDGGFSGGYSGGCSGGYAGGYSGGYCQHGPGRSILAIETIENPYRIRRWRKNLFDL